MVFQLIDMKKIAFVFSLIAIMTMAYTPTFAQKIDYDKVEVQVDGLGCPFCAYGLEKKFKELKGIKKVRIDMETGVMTFNYPSDKMIDIETIETQVDKAGYTPVTTEITRSSGEVVASVREDEILEAETLANAQKASFKVRGNCSMCKARIEKAANELVGVDGAVWEAETQLIKLKYDATVTDIEAIHKAIAKVGHDTKKAKANDEVYENLPPCCLYKRN